ncbi:MAG: FAD-binding domain-containing protein [Steroidobacteraceae bacterium]
MIEPVQIVWFKRDLRLEDHAPLALAARAGTVLPLFVIEPELLYAPDFDRLHYEFLSDALLELRSGLASLGQPLVVRLGEMPQVLAQLGHEFTIAALWSHAEIGNALVRARDERVRTWTRERAIPWYELPQNGVFRGPIRRDGWRRLWIERMSLPVARMPHRLSALPGLDIGSIPLATELGLYPNAPAVRGRQGVARGGESRAWNLLDSFLGERGANYPRALANPTTAAQASSRLSPYLAWGCISMRTVFQRTANARQALELCDRVSALGVPFAAGALESFSVRLKARCEAMQSLECAPEIATRCLDPASEILRAEERSGFYEAWSAGRTGYPMVDACMRALQATGWLHYRGRALLASFAMNQLWIDWRQLRDFLARQFIDYEPGVHFMELQSLAGVAGRRTLRIYDAVREGRQLDPDGDFIRQWLPELAALPHQTVHEPWHMTGTQQSVGGCRLGHDYPLPIIDQAEALAQARARMKELNALAAASSERSTPDAAGLQQEFSWQAQGPQPDEAEEASRRRSGSP